MPIPERLENGRTISQYFETESSDDVKAAKETLMSSCSSYLPESDLARISEAFDIAYYFHNAAPFEKRFRGTGEHFMTHPAAVAQIVADWHTDATTVCAALLHDTREDTAITDEEIEKYFGKEVLSAVRTVTKVTGLSDEVNERKTIEKIYLAFLADPRGILIKLADRLHNIRTIKGIKDKNKRRKFATQTLSVFVPLAIKVGMGDLADELTDRSLEVLLPEAVKQAESVRKENCDCAHTYSLFLPVEEAMVREVSNPDAVLIEVLDVPLHSLIDSQRLEAGQDDGGLRSIRIVCADQADFTKIIAYLQKYVRSIQLADSVKDGQFECGFIYGEVNFHLSVMNVEALARITSSLATLYQVAEEDDEFYKRQRIYALALVEKPQMLLSQLLDEGGTSPIKWVAAVQEGMRQNLIEVLTPRGEKRVLYEGATAWDFAFDLFSEIGLTAEGAVINGEVRSLDTVLHEGDTVEIVCSGKGWTIGVETMGQLHYSRHRKEVSKQLRRILGLSEELQRQEVKVLPQKCMVMGVTNIEELEQKAQTIVSEAQARGRRRLLDLYMAEYRKLYFEVFSKEAIIVRERPLIDLERGWQGMDRRFHKRFGSYDGFLVDSGLENIEKDRLVSYVKSIIEYEQKLPQLRLLVPDRRGVIARLTAVAAVTANIVNVKIEHNLPYESSRLSEIVFQVDVVDHGELMKLYETLDIFAEMMRERYQEEESSEQAGETIVFTCQIDRNIGPFVAVLEGLGVKVLGIERTGGMAKFEIQPLSGSELMRLSSPSDIDEINSLLGMLSRFQT